MSTWVNRSRKSYLCVHCGAAFEWHEFPKRCVDCKRDWSEYTEGPMEHGAYLAEVKKVRENLRKAQV